MKVTNTRGKRKTQVNSDSVNSLHCYTITIEMYDKFSDFYNN